MRVDKLIRTAIATALKGNIIEAGEVVQVYHNAPDDAKKPFIEIIGQSTASNKQNKDNGQFESIVPIRVLTAHIGGGGGDSLADEIEQKVIDLLDDKLTIPDHSIVQTDYNSTSLNQQFGREFQTNKILNFSFTIIKN